MNAQDLTLNIAVNLGRLSRWVSGKKLNRVPMFLEETAVYLDKLERMSKAKKFRPTFEKFKERFEWLKKNSFDENWADEALTWANILTHRAKLA